jgi:hypothetical protein
VVIFLCAMNPPAKLSDLITALEMASEEICLRYDRQTGSIVTVDRSVLEAAEEGEEETLTDLPDWQKEEVELTRAIANDDGTRFLDAPDKSNFHEYRHMERFIGTVEDEQSAEELRRAIKGKGAFRYFKDSARRLGLLDQWYRYRDKAMKEFVIEWAQASQVPFEDDSARSPA